jgi:hypothetical protein
MKASPKLASFAQVDTSPVNAEMWPVHALLWLQPDLYPARPRASGLRIERRYKPPAPDFVRPGMEPASPAQTRERACEPQASHRSRWIPQSGLAPLGWDPRREKGAA